MGISLFNNKNISFASIHLANDTINSLPIININGGLNASATTFIRGDNTWVAISSTSLTNSPPRNIKLGGVTQNPGLTSVAAMFTSAAPATSGTATLQQGSDGEYIKYTTGASVSSIGGWNSAGTLRITRLQWQPIISFVIRTDTLLTSIRNWFGLFSADPSLSDTLLNSMGFCYSTAVDGTAFWRTYTSNGTTNTRIITTSPIAISTRYVLQIDATNQSSINFYINGVLVSTHTTNLPVNTTPLDYYARTTTLTAATRATSLSRIHYEHANV